MQPHAEDFDVRSRHDRGDDGTHPERIPYQETLRALGSWLDERFAQRVNVLEAMGGFAVRYQVDRQDPGTESFFLTYGRLRDLDVEYEERRQRHILLLPSHDAPQPTYENLLRALGYELDEVDADTILIDEIDEGMLVTYQFLCPSEGFQARKRMVIVGVESMKAVLADARARREYKSHTRFSLRAG